MSHNLGRKSHRIEWCKFAVNIP